MQLYNNLKLLHVEKTILSKFLFAGDVMEQTDGNEESSSKPIDENGTSVSTVDDTGDSSKRQTTQEKSGSDLHAGSPKPNVEASEVEPNLALEDSAIPSAIGNEQTSADSAEVNVTENANGMHFLLFYFSLIIFF